MKRIAIYCVDQDWDSTSTMGIYNYTKGLVHALSQQPDPGISLILWLSESNRADFTPANLPSWMSVRGLPGCYGRGLRRIWADHVLSSRLAKQDGINLVHFPKGWIPLKRMPRTRVVATLHDTIVQYYREQFPSFFSPLKLLYFDKMTRLALQRADRIITPTNFSKRELVRLRPEIDGKITVIGIGASLPAPQAPRDNARDGIVVIGALSPHKATLQTLSLLDAFAKRTNQLLRVTVTNLRSWPEQWGRTPSGLDLQLVGRLTDTEFADLLQSARALVLLSLIEGFGIPLLDSYTAGTPVCYRRTSAIAEVMEGCPGGWDGENPDTFFATLDEVLHSATSTINNTRDRLLARYNWTRTAKETLGVYLDMLGAA